MLLNNVYAKNRAHMIENVMLYPGENTASYGVCGVYLGGEP
jgi:hypothetical protein